MKDLKNVAILSLITLFEIVVISKIPVFPIRLIGNFLSLTLIAKEISKKLKLKINLNIKCEKKYLAPTILIIGFSLFIYILLLKYIPLLKLNKSTTEIHFYKVRNLIEAVTFQLLYVSIPEEFFFRGIIQENLKLKQEQSLISKCNIITSVIFAVFHIVKFRNLTMVKVFFPSLIFGYLYEKTNSLCFPILTHLIFNLFYLYASPL